MGAPKRPPNPPAFGAPRHSRVAPLNRASSWGPEMADCLDGGPETAPKPPNVRSAPAQPGRSSKPRQFMGPRNGRLFRWGPRNGPQTPQGSERPGEAVPRL